MHFMCVCVFSSGCTCDWTRGETGQSNARDACDELMLQCCPYVRDLRNCFVEICEAVNSSMILNVLLQTKEKYFFTCREG